MSLSTAQLVFIGKPIREKESRKNKNLNYAFACRGSRLWEDYKIDFFAFLGLVFVPLRKILNFQSWVRR